MKFTYNSRIIKQLGAELITSDEIAITELIKNSYDAKAEKIRINFLSELDKVDEKNLINPIPEKVKEELKKYASSKIIIIEDSGTGMNYETLQKGFFDVGSDYKINKKKESANNSEILFGDKGIGRLSAQRLSPILFVETTSNKNNENEKEKNIYLIKIIWDKFIKNNNEDAPEYIIEKKKDVTYTRLWLIDNKDNPTNFNKHFTEDTKCEQDDFGKPIGEPFKYIKLKEELQSALNFLYMPFDSDKSAVDLKLFFNKDNIHYDFHSTNIEIAESIHSFSFNENENDFSLNLDMDIKPWFLERIHNKLVGNKLFHDYKQNHKYYKDIYLKYKNRFSSTLKISYSMDDLKNIKFDNNIDIFENLKKITPVKGKIYTFKRDPQLLRMAIDSALENNYIKKDTKIYDIKPFLDTHNGIKLYRNKFRIGTLGNKDNDWLKFQQKATTGQQFYRFELGNVIGFVQINDPLQTFISETSSRSDLTFDPCSYSLRILLDHIFSDTFYKFTKNATDITKDILNEEGLIPKNTTKDIRKEIDKSNELLKSTQESLKAFAKAIKVIKENIELDTPEKIESVKSIVNSLTEITDSFDNNISLSIDSLKNYGKILSIAEQEKKRIEVEAYNNYKLMANGLITEVITHELHSLVSNLENDNTYNENFKLLKNYLFDMKNYELNKDHLEPLRKNYVRMQNKIDDVTKFYKFLEKTFIYNGTDKDFETINLKSFLNDFLDNYKARLKNNNIVVKYESTSIDLKVPRGSLMHVFYNLFENSIYWIQERQRKARYDKSFAIDTIDNITILKKDKNVIQCYDTGFGVLEKYQYTLFHPLISGKEDGKGRGMGLYIVKKFLESFDADIELLPFLNKFNNRYIFEITFNKEMQEIQDES